MTTEPVVDREARTLKLSVEAFIRIGLLALVSIWSLSIVRPFVPVVAWSAILSVSLRPLQLGLMKRAGIGPRTSALFITLVMLALLLVPSAWFFTATIQEVRLVARSAQAGDLDVPPPPPSVREWPVVGEVLYERWLEASESLDKTLTRLAPELQRAGAWCLGALGGLASATLQFFVSILIAGWLLLSAEQARAFALKFATRLAGSSGEPFVDLAIRTVRSVFQGVLGIAVIQSLLAAVGMLVVGVPAAMLWSLFVLVLAVVQLPPILVLGPVMFWAFTAKSTTVAVLFTIYGLIVGSSDTFLKPLLLGRGVNVPMVVILLGAIGGMVSTGIIGLFVGAVVLAVGYQIFVAWIDDPEGRAMTAARLTLAQKKEL